MTQSATQAKPRLFVVDMPARTLKKMPGLSKNARRLYGAMRALANGRTGELAIRSNPLDWRYIARQAEMGRDVWQHSLNELMAVGLASRERETVTIYKSGRRRVVWGACHYFVYRQPKTTKKPYILPMPDSSAAEESGTQVFSETPTSARLGSAGSDFVVSEAEREKSSSPADRLDDFKKITLAKCKDPDGILSTALDIIIDRARGSGINVTSPRYLETSLKRFNFEEGQDREELMQWRRGRGQADSVSAALPCDSPQFSSVNHKNGDFLFEGVSTLSTEGKP
jgi:hypothetical protein